MHKLLHTLTVLTAIAVRGEAASGLRSPYEPALSYSFSFSFSYSSDVDDEGSISPTTTPSVPSATLSPTEKTHDLSPSPSLHPTSFAALSQGSVSALISSFAVADADGVLFAEEFKNAGARVENIEFRQLLDEVQGDFISAMEDFNTADVIFTKTEWVDARNEAPIKFAEVATKLDSATAKIIVAADTYESHSAHFQESDPEFAERAVVFFADLESHFRAISEALARTQTPQPINDATPLPSTAPVTTNAPASTPINDATPLPSTAPVATNAPTSTPTLTVITLSPSAAPTTPSSPPTDHPSSPSADLTSPPTATPVFVPTSIDAPTNEGECYIEKCGCPTAFKETWCDELNSVMKSPWCSESASNCFMCNGTIC